MRYFIVFSYFGKSYHGWQIQPNAITVQEVLEDGLSKLLRQGLSVVGAGRTDAGVHAKQMYAHFDFDGEFDVDELVYRLNALLPDDIAIAEIRAVKEDAHARFDAIERTYEYWITQEKNPFYLDSAHYLRHRLDVPAMNEAARLLMEHRDFECFSKSNTDVRTFNCDVKKAEWTVDADKLVFTIVADRFLRNMVRAVVGTLIEVGIGKSDLEYVRNVLKSKDRSLAGPSVPAKGLYLTKISYPESLQKYE
ncbi:tRNA pseudouridine(38-40) synthase TruA [Maribacter polysiphoniae]|uniref:tRNA pseudouridine synthase A n=1 Tax=Maribacter polysiphoniae TaxID=429344 RepID=A0A316E483_9FLAO|nr:tRNA pseudouridine(38-40) synthase TruA [Maribacter polysiphoniae]MBD1259326.1 tRNA pseudouridine(38-40) synthase TruA [Maribacter polysiphoniae]PWK24886.1 tRNA pseudouridine38-40 synthase [Maribacter polysiphoniae]